MQKKRVFLIGGSVLAITVAGLLIVPSFIDWSKYQTLATTKIAEETGYDVNIGGAFRVSFLPRPTLSAKQISITKPNGARAVTLATLEGVDVSIALLPLIGGRIDISSITLDTPNVQLVKYKDGTDNFTPVLKPSDTQPAQDPAANKAEPAASPDIAIGALNIKGGTFLYADEATGTKQQIGIEKLRLKADSITGPFEADGTIAYNDAAFKIDLSTGGYRAGETLPIRLEATDTQSRASLTWNGVVTTGDNIEAQGETQLKLSNIAGVLADANIAANLPAIPTIALSGMLTATPNSARLTNGALQLDKTRLSTSFEWQNTDGTQLVKLRADTPEIINLDALLKQLPSTKSTGKSTGTKTDSDPANTATNNADASGFLPANLSLPTGLSADIVLRAGGLEYKGQKTGATSFELALPQSGNTANIRASVVDMPGEGDVSLNASLNAGAAPNLSGNVIATLPNLKSTLSGWLGLMDAKIIDDQGLPNRANAEIGFRIAGQAASATLNPLSFGETRLTGSVTYRKSAPRPVITANLNADLLNLPAPKNSASPQTGKSGQGASTQSKSSSGKPFTINAPALPFDVNFDLKLGRFSRGDNILTDITAAGSYSGKSLTLTQAGATTRGGNLNLSGRVADLAALSGIDVKAALRTSDLEGFYKAITANELPLKQTIGAFNANVTAKGDSQKMDADLNLKARGFTVDASGSLDNPFSPGLPEGLKLRIRHDDYIQAMRTFAPEFGSGAGAPLDISGDIAIKNNVYDLKNLKAQMGKSDMSGNLRADLSGSKPAITANLSSNTLDLGSFVGVESKAPAQSSPIRTVSANSNSRWSRDALDTGFMHQMNLDITAKAGQLTYGTWVLTDANLTTKLNNGNLSISPFSAHIYGGTFTGNLNASAPNAAPNSAQIPMSVTFKAEGKDADIGAFLSALTSSTAKKADGKGSFNIDLKTTGASPAALVSGVNGKADITAQNLVIHGIDLDKLAANLVEAFDGGWKGVLSAIPAEGLATGSTSFKTINHNFPVENGVLHVRNFNLETTSANAMMRSNGDVNFSTWSLDLDNQVQVTQPKDVPVLGMRLYGSLSAPQKSINSTALDNLLREKLGGQVQKLLDKNIKDEGLRGIVGGVLGLQPQTQQQPAAPTGTSPDAQAPANQAPTNQAPAAQPAAPAKTPEQQLIEGLGGLLGGRR